MAKEYSYGVCPWKIENNKIYILLNKTGRVGDWNFFKGKIESGETVQECAIREFFEESGVKIKEKDLGNFFYQTGSRKDVGIFLYKWNNEDIHIDPKEIFSYDWVEIKSDVKTSRNQQQNYNNIFLYFKGIRILETQ